MNEINAHDAEHKSSAGISDWKKTSLVPYMEVFIAFVKGLEKEAFHVKTERVDGKCKDIAFIIKVIS